MDDVSSFIDAADATHVRRAVLARLRYEQSLGLECVPRFSIPLTPRERADESALSRGDSSATAIPNSIDKSARWQELEIRATGCVRCMLHKGRTHVVFGTGNRNAELVFVGEGPGHEEDSQGLPFVGKAGQLLDKIIEAMKFRRNDVYLCNVVKCRPPDNRPPLPDEIATCSPYLIEQLELIAPKVIVTLGGPATKMLLNSDAGILKLRGRWSAYKSIPVMPTFHPAFVLHQYTPEIRGQVWSDMQKVMEKLKS